MRIYADGMFFRLSGIGRIYEYAMGALVDSEEVSRIYTLVPRSREQEFPKAFPSRKIEARFVDFSSLSFSDFFRKSRLIGEFRPAPDLFFFPNFNVPFRLTGRIVSTICDLIPMSAYSDLPWIKKLAFRYLVGRSLRVSAKTVCISETVREEVVEEFGIPGDRMSVIYPWVDNGYFRPAGNDDPGRMVQGDYLLFVGNRFVHKNIGGLLKTFLILVNDFPRLKLVVVGARMRPRDAVDDAEENPELRGRVIPFPRATDEELRNLYRHARAFVFPTFTEGFGIPPLEALATGIPVVCSDIPVIREVCGDAVRYAPPDDPAAFAREIRAVLSGPAEGGGSRDRAMERIRSFGKERSMDRYMELFRACCLI